MAAYSFDEGGGTTVVDLSGNGNHGNVSNAAWTATGKYGKALVFNGTNAVVTVNDSASLRLTSAVTLEAWVNPSASVGGWRDVIYKGNDNYYLEGSSDNGGVLAAGGTFAGANANLYGPGALPINAWSHIAATYDGAALRLYVNGALVSSQSVDGLDRDVEQPVADRRRQHLRPILPRGDRRSSDLQPRAHAGGDPGRHGRAARIIHRSADKPHCNGCQRQSSRSELDRRTKRSRNFELPHRAMPR